MLVDQEICLSIWTQHDQFEDISELFRFGCCRTCTLITTTYEFPNSVPDDKSATSDDSEVRQLRQSLMQCREDLSHEREASAHLRQLVTQREERDAQIQQHQEYHSEMRMEKDAQIRKLQQHLSDLRREKDSQTRQLQQHLSDLRREKDSQTQKLQQHLSDVRRECQQLQQCLSDVRSECQHLWDRIGTTLPLTHSQEVEFWRVSPEEVQVNQHEILGRGAWGYVAKGKFRGQIVAVKCIYPSILQPTTMDRIRREISTMAQVRHPNLVLFIAAVLDEQTGPMIITEILDTNLRTAYKENHLGSNKVRIFQDIASALNYLHLHGEPIIHRDVSTPNVLLLAVANNMWKAKLSDFGSANLVRYATTPGEGAIIYTAPEAFPQPPTSPTPPPHQTPKIDVYSYGVLLCEVVTQEFPDPSRLQGMIRKVRRQWPQIHPLVTGCIQHSPESRPTMAYILEELDRLTL